MRLFIVPALLAAAVAVPAMAAPLQHFSRDGQAYSYTATRLPSGVVLLHGTVDTTGDAFDLRVDGTKVSGQLGISPVMFTVSPETAMHLVDEVPARSGAMTQVIAAN